MSTIDILEYSLFRFSLFFGVNHNPYLCKTTEPAGQLCLHIFGDTQPSVCTQCWKGTTKFVSMPFNLFICKVASNFWMHSVGAFT
jgi:hypothetical protein